MDINHEPLPPRNSPELEDAIAELQEIVELFAEVARKDSIEDIDLFDTFDAFDEAIRAAMSAVALEMGRADARRGL